MIRTARVGPVARVRFDRPDKRNAITAEMYRQLADALATADREPEVRAILLHGSSDCFTAGTDLGELLEPRAADVDSPARPLFEVFPNLEKPVVAAVGGPAIGIGSTMLLHCDLVYVAPEARFQFPFVPLGIVPEFASTFLLPLIAGHQSAAGLLLLGRPFDAQEAHRAGIVTAVVPRNDLLAEAEKVAEALAELPVEALRITKRLMKSRYKKAIAETIAEENRAIHDCLRSAGARERMAGLLRKGTAER